MGPRGFLLVLGEAVDFVNTWGGFIGTVATGAGVVGTLLERRYRLTYRAGRLWAKARNADLAATIKLEFVALQPFDELKSRVKEGMRVQGEHFRVVRDGPARFEIAFEGMLVVFIDTGPGALYVGVERFQSTMRGLRPALKNLLGALESLSIADENSPPALGRMKYADVGLVLPYKWEALSVRDQKRFSISKYSVTLQQRDGKAEVEFTVDDMRIRSASTDDLLGAIARFS